MSKLKVTSIANIADTESTNVTNVINGSAKAWVSFNGTGTVAIRTAFNVSSITDNGTGNYTVNMTNPMIDTNYAITYSDYSWGLGWQDTLTTSSFKVLPYNSGFANQDVAWIWVTVFR